MGQTQAFIVTLLRIHSRRPTFLPQDSGPCDLTASCSSLLEGFISFLHGCTCSQAFPMHKPLWAKPPANHSTQGSPCRMPRDVPMGRVSDPVIPPTHSCGLLPYELALDLGPGLSETKYGSHEEMALLMSGASLWHDLLGWCLGWS